MLEYQDALHPDRVGAGERDCSQRWAVIEPFMESAESCLDVGSNLGYFSIKAAKQPTRPFVLSLESEAAIAARQARLLREHDLSNVLLIRGALDARSASAWAESCDWFDVTLLLAVLHWMDDPAVVLKALSGMSGKLIVELPDPEDKGSCNGAFLREMGDPVAWCAAVSGRAARSLGRVDRHTSKTQSHLVMIDGPVRRSVDKPYLGSSYQHPAGNYYEHDFDGLRHSFLRRGESQTAWLHGVNLVNAMHLGQLMWPSPKALGATMPDVSGHPDPMPHNMIISSTGLTLIDDDDLTDPHAVGRAARSLRRNLRRWSVGRGRYVAYRLLSYPKLRRGLSRLKVWKRASTTGSDECPGRPKNQEG